MIGLLSLCFERPFAVAWCLRPVHGATGRREDLAASFDPDRAGRRGRPASRWKRTLRRPRFLKGAAGVSKLGKGTSKRCRSVEATCRSGGLPGFFFAQTVSELSKQASEVCRSRCLSVVRAGQLRHTSAKQLRRDGAMRAGPNRRQGRHPSAVETRPFPGRALGRPSRK
jgi:hypothetical protein